MTASSSNTPSDKSHKPDKSLKPGGPRESDPKPPDQGSTFLRKLLPLLLLALIAILFAYLFRRNM